MARPHDYSALPSHPAVSAHYKKERKYGYTTVVADVTCPKCSKVRAFPLYTLRQQMKRPGFDGQCRKCALVSVREGAMRWRIGNFKEGHHWLASTGYVMIGTNSVASEDLPLFKSMLGKANGLLQHRFVMAKVLGRPLRSNECVDHMDGNKQNNEPSNLRLYRRGRNDPGSTCGHGTYYHEWQMAEARNRLLFAELNKLRSPS